MKYIDNIIICDTCGEIIISPEHGMVEWIKEQGNIKDIHIVHNRCYSPRNPQNCYQHATHEFFQDANLDYILRDKSLMEELGLVKKITVVSLMDCID